MAEVSSEQRIERSRVLYEQAVFGGDVAALVEADRELDAVEADLALARGRVVHARFLDGGARGAGDRELEELAFDELALFERAAELYRELGDERGEGEALFWVGTFHQVVRRDERAARSPLERSAELADAVDDRLTLSYALRHLCFSELAAGRPDTATEYLEHSTALRRELGFRAGVAANLVGLAYLAADTGQPEDVRALLDEADELVAASGAHGVGRWVVEARESLISKDEPE